MIILVSVAVVGLLGLIGLILTVYWVTSLFKERALAIRTSPPGPGFEVVSVNGDHVTLKSLGTQSLSLYPTFVGLAWRDGYAQMGKVLDVLGKEHTRTFVLLEGTLSVGLRVRIDYAAFPRDPSRAYGIRFENALFDSPVGRFEAWYVDGNGPIWVIFVHGHRTGPVEALRILPLMVRLEFPSLAIKYRNDYGAPRDDSGFHWFGLTEWEDLEAAVEYGVDHGAKQFVLVGYSMGGSIVLNFLYKSDLATKIAGIILDSPMLDLNATMDFGAARRNVPKTVIALAKRLSTIRFGVQWDMLNYLQNIHLIEGPTLLLHSESDNLVPVAPSDLFASARPDTVVCKRFDRAPHGGIWNTEKKIYEQCVQSFLEELIGPVKIDEL